MGGKWKLEHAAIERQLLCGLCDVNADAFGC